MNELNMLTETGRVLLTQLGLFLPRLGIALVIVVVGWLLAKAARFAVDRTLRAINLPVVTERAGIDDFLRHGALRIDAVGLLAGIVYGLVLALALLLAFNSLGLDYVTELVRAVVLYLPRLALAWAVIVFGAYFARVVGDSVRAVFRRSSAGEAQQLGRVARVAVLLFVLLIALDQLALGSGIVQQSFLILLAGVVLALALAFGLGGRAWAAALLQRWFPLQTPPSERDPPERR